MSDESICELCERDCTNKKMNKHHISYEKDITIKLCYSCHQLMHGRPIFKNMNVWTYEFGKDFGFYILSKKFIKIFEDKVKFKNKEVIEKIICQQEFMKEKKELKKLKEELVKH